MRLAVVLMAVTIGLVLELAHDNHDAVVDSPIERHHVLVLVLLSSRQPVEAVSAYVAVAVVPANPTARYRQPPWKPTVLARIMVAAIHAIATV